jgi:hypothetical protein
MVIAIGLSKFARDTCISHLAGNQNRFNTTESRGEKNATN